MTSADPNSDHQAIALAVLTCSRLLFGNLSRRVLIGIEGLLSGNDGKDIFDLRHLVGTGQGLPQEIWHNVLLRRCRAERTQNGAEHHTRQCQSQRAGHNNQCYAPFAGTGLRLVVVIIIPAAFPLFFPRSDRGRTMGNHNVASVRPGGPQLRSGFVYLFRA